MRKEVLFAIFAGIAFGLVIGFGIWRANTAFKAKGPAEDQPTATDASGRPEPTEILKEEITTGLTIAKPEDLDVVTNSPVTVTGITKPNTKLVISAEDVDYLLQSGNDGAFSQEVELIPGVNQVIIQSFPEGDPSVNKTLRLVFSTEFAATQSASTSN